MTTELSGQTRVEAELMQLRSIWEERSGAIDLVKILALLKQLGPYLPLILPFTVTWLPMLLDVLAVIFPNNDGPFMHAQPQGARSPLPLEPIDGSQEDVS